MCILQGFQCSWIDQTNPWKERKKKERQKEREREREREREFNRYTV